jgi:carbonic anhydrase/acetyltransferase-like protein (isoleucine patch superfamily)
MGAIVLDGARICKNSIVAAGAMVLEGFNVPEGMFVAGVPAKIKRPLNGRRKTIFTSVGCELYSLS